MSRYRLLGVLLLGLLGLTGTTQAAPLASPSAAAPPCPPAPPPAQIAGEYRLLDGNKTTHLQAIWACQTTETTLQTYAGDSLQLLTGDGRVEINHYLRQDRLTAANGVSVYGGVPLTVEGGAGATINADGGYQVAGTPGLSATIPLPPDGWLRVQGGLVTAAQPPSQPSGDRRYTAAAVPTDGVGATVEYDILTTQAPYPVLWFDDATAPWFGYVGTLWAGYDRTAATLTLYLPDPAPPAPCPHDCYQGQISYRFLKPGSVEDVLTFDTSLPANLPDQGTVLPTVQLKTPPRLVVQLPPQGAGAP